jgi:hypothetical protein
LIIAGAGVIVFSPIKSLYRCWVVNSTYVPSQVHIFKSNFFIALQPIAILLKITMKLYKLVSVALALPVMMSPATAQGSHLVSEALSSLVKRQSSLGGVISDISGLLKGIEGLLTPTSLNNIEAIITDASTLLSPPTTNQTKALLGTASDLLTGPLVTDLIDKLPNLVNFGRGLIQQGLVTNLTDILGGAHDLLTQEFVTETKGIIKELAPVRPTA